MTLEDSALPLLILQPSRLPKRLCLRLAPLVSSSRGRADPLSPRPPPSPPPPLLHPGESLSPVEKRRKHNIITISKSRFLMSSRGHNVPSSWSFVCHSRCFSRRIERTPFLSSSPLPRRVRSKGGEPGNFSLLLPSARARARAHVCVRSRSSASLAND